jgi:signal transduction histidine kinase
VGAVVALLPDAFAAIRAQPVDALAWMAALSLASVTVISYVARHQVETSLRTPVAVASAVLLPPPLAMLTTLCSITSDRELRGGASPWMITYNHAQLALVTYVAAFVADAQPFGWLLGALVAIPVYDAVNTLFVSVAVWLLGRVGLREAARTTFTPFPNALRNYVLSSLLAVLLVVLHRDVGLWAFVLFAVPVGLGYAAMRSAREASDRADELAARVRELEVVNRLGTGLLSARDRQAVMELAVASLRQISGEDVNAAQVVVAIDGAIPEGLVAWDVPGSTARVGLPPDLDERRRAEVEVVCGTIGLALQRLAVEGELHEAQVAQAALAEQILTEGTTQRSRLALLVHDDVLPYLAAAQIQADNVLTAAELGNTPMTMRLANTVRDAVEGGIRTLRRVLDDLQRQTIVPGDLLPSIRQAAEQTRVEHGLVVHIDADDYRGGLSHPSEILLTESVAGLLGNVAKHARAEHVQVRLASDEQRVSLSVADDGIGFDPSAIPEGHHGLALMQQRVALAHGRFHIESAPGRGAVVEISVPTLRPQTPLPPPPADDRIPTRVPTA